jgi:hypothetical protein
MSVNNYDELVGHFGHIVTVVKYGEQNCAIECEECCEVLLDFDRPEAQAGKCELCHGNGWVDSNNEAGEDEIQRCDACGIFDNDADARLASMGVASRREHDSAMIVGWCLIGGATLIALALLVWS